MTASPEARHAARRRRATRLAVALLVAAAAWGGWLAARAGLDVGSYWTDGDRAFDGRPAVRSAVWDEAAPVLLPDAPEARRPTLSPDGRLLVFALGERGLNAELFACDRLPDGWGAPRPLVRLNSLADELAPSFGPDGLWFASDRGPLDRGLDLWRAPWDELGFGEPELLAPALQSDADDTDPVSLGDGRVAFASDRGGAGFDLYLADLSAPHVEARPLTALNSAADEREPAVDASGAALWFVSDRDGDFDPYRSFRARDGWLPPRPVVELATAQAERGPWVAPDGFTLWFERGGDDARAVHVARSRELYRVPGPPLGWREWFLLAALLVLALAAWLSRRYRGLEFLTRCLLASLLLHLALLWWLRHVRPDAETYVGVPEETRYAVTLLPSGDAAEGGRAASDGAPGPTWRAASLPRPAVRARTVTARAAEPARDRSDVAPVEPTRADETAPLEVALPTVSAPAPRPEPVAALAPAVRGVERTVARTGAARLSRESLRAEARPSELGGGVVRVPRADAGERVAADAGPVAPARTTHLGDAGDARLELPAPPVEALATPAPEGGGDGATPTVVAFGGQVLRPSRGPSRRGPRRPSAPAPEASVAGDVAEHLARPGTELEEARVDVRPVRPEASRRVPDVARGSLPLPTAERASRLAAGDPGGAEAERLRSVRFDPARRDATRGPRRHATTPSALALAAAPVDLVRRVDADEPRVDAGPPVAPLYGNRFGAEKERALTRFGGDERTEASVANGLRYLASIQREDGAWGPFGSYHEKYHDVRVGKTGLALLAFLGAGQVPGRACEHRDAVERGLRWLLDQQREGGHLGDSNAYGHGIATYALAEAWAITRWAPLEDGLVRAVEHVLENQTRARDVRNGGGWPYYSESRRGYEGDRWSRVSVTAWQVMALVSARTSGLAVPDEALEGARAFLLSAWDAELGAYRYSHDPERLGSDYPTLPASTPAALFALSLLGEDVASPRFAGGRGFLARMAPRTFDTRRERDFVFRGDGNLYLWAYATLALFRVGGDEWSRWNVALKDVLLPRQEADGSWPSRSIYSQFADDQDRAYSTALCVLMMEVYYRYVTPTVSAPSGDRTGVIVR